MSSTNSSITLRLSQFITGSYIIEWNTTTNNGTTGTISGSSVTVNDLTPNTVYTFTAQNFNGETQPPDSVTIATGLLKPKKFTLNRIATVMFKF